MSDPAKPPREKSRYLPPSPLELAKLALLIEQREAIEWAAKVIANPVLARTPRLKRAIGFDIRDRMIEAVNSYVEAVEAHDEFLNLSDENLALLLRGPKTAQDFFKYVLGREWYSKERKYRLYDKTIKPDHSVYGKDFLHGLDPVRNYLMAHASNFDWKRPDTVLDNIYGFFEEHAMAYDLHNKAEIEKFQVQIAEIAAQMDLPVDTVLEWRFGNDVRRKVADAGVALRFLQIVAISEKSADLADQMVGWSFSKEFLDQLVRWRYRRKKQMGGRSKRRPDKD